MKQHISLDDLRELSDSQKQRLLDLWLPAKYDVALANICIDVSNDEYDEVVFILGKVVVNKYGDMTLYDFGAMSDQNEDLDETEEKTLKNNATLDSSRLGTFINPESTVFPGATSLNTAKATAGEVDNECGPSDEQYDEAFDDYDFSYERPTSFPKESCMPLLSIGQMIDILHRTDWESFYLTVGTLEKGCEVGNRGANVYGFDDPRESEELCDILWAAVKEVLSK
ncbi:MAG: hypothetical protein N2645_12135 [Clostridia bacterium]|nr:hypothetical protein [Clostridia bacterium]